MTVKEQIKTALAKRDITLKEVHERLKSKYNKTDTIQNLNSKINRNSLKYSEMLEIADVLDFEITWKDKNK